MCLIVVGNKDKVSKQKTILENALRITLGTKEELNKTMEALKKFQRKNG